MNDKSYMSLVVGCSEGFFVLGGNSMKKNTVVFIDGENISAKKIDAILWVVNQVGVLDSARVYGLKNDRHTRGWTKRASEIDALEDVRLSGGAAKNKDDKRIKQDMLNVILEKRNVDIFVLVSSDHGYAETIRELRQKGKKVVVLGKENNMSDQLIRTASEAYVC